MGHRRWTAGIAVAVVGLTWSAVAMAGEWVVDREATPDGQRTNVVASLDAVEPFQDWLGEECRPRLVLSCEDGATRVAVDVGSPLEVEVGRFHQSTVNIRLTKGKAKTVVASHNDEGEGLLLPKPEKWVKSLAGEELLHVQFLAYRIGPQEVHFELDGIDAVVDDIREACDW